MHEFDYRIVSKNNITVVTFSGKLTKESRDQLETCRQQLISEASEMVVIYFKDVSTIEPSIFREFTLLQQDIRKKKAELFLTGLSSQIKQYLIDRAVIRLTEVRKTLLEVLEKKTA